MKTRLPSEFKPCPQVSIPSGRASLPKIVEVKALGRLRLGVGCGKII